MLLIRIKLKKIDHVLKNGFESHFKNVSYVCWKKCVLTSSSCRIFMSRKTCRKIRHMRHISSKCEYKNFYYIKRIPYSILKDLVRAFVTTKLHSTMYKLYFLQSALLCVVGILPFIYYYWLWQRKMVRQTHKWSVTQNFTSMSRSLGSLSVTPASWMYKKKKKNFHACKGRVE
jgi:hypothetical protein